MSSTAPWTATAPISPDKITYLELPATTPRETPHNDLVQCVKDLVFPMQAINLNQETKECTPSSNGQNKSSPSQVTNRNIPNNQVQNVRYDNQVGTVNDIESDTGAIYTRKQARIQRSTLFTRWYESGGDGPINNPPLIRPCLDSIAIGDLFIHKYRSTIDGVDKELEQIWLLKMDTENTNKLRWFLVEDMGTTHHPDTRLKDRILSMTKQLARPSWISPATKERSKFSNA